MKVHHQGVSTMKKILLLCGAGISTGILVDKLEEARDKLGKDDYLLGWQDTRSSFRYCHSFSEDDVDRLAERAIGQARLLARYRADGKNGRSNEYLVFRREDTDE